MTSPDAPKAAEVLAHVDLFGVDDEREAAEIEVAALLAYGSSEGVAILPDGTLWALEAHPAIGGNYVPGDEGWPTFYLRTDALVEPEDSDG